jgi:hypothetical protein
VPLSSSSPRPPREKGSGSGSGRPFYGFPYREEEEVADPRSGQPSSRLLRPTLDVELSLGDLHHRMRALIDTGGTRTLFPRGVGDALKINFGPSAPRRTVFVAGGEWSIVRGDVVLSVADVPGMWWHTQVFFFEEEWEITFGILGHQGFLDHCVVSFHASAGYFVIESIEDWEARVAPDPFEVFQERNGEWHRPAAD